ncbi:MAG: SEC-C metal-binding domain-containing protein [Pseudomonadota bacterium]
MRKKKMIAADEGFEIGPLRMMRFGKINVLQNRMSEDQHAKFMERLAGRYHEVCEEIDEIVRRIATAVAGFSPLPLLHRAYWEYFLSAMGIQSEVEEGKEGVEKRFIVEYLQSMICAVTPHTKQSEQPTDTEWSMLTTDIASLIHKIASEYLITHTAWAERNDPNFDERQERFAVQAQLHWLAVRGDRYLCHDVPHFRDLLTPHDVQFRHLFGVSTDEVIHGIEQIIGKFSRGPRDAFEALDDFRTATLDALQQSIDTTGETGSPAELMDKVIHANGWEEWRDRVHGDAMGYGLFDMEAVTGWPRTLLDCLSWQLGEDTTFMAHGSFSGWPLRVLPIWKRPFLKIDGRYYTFGIYPFTDHGYRIFQRTLTNLDPSYKETWNSRQKDISEALPLSLLGRLLPGATVYQSVYYQWATGSAGTKQWCETDGLLIYDDHLIVVEVRAGAFTHTPPSSDFPAYISSLNALLRKPSEQTDRFCAYLGSEPQVTIYDSGHFPIGTLEHTNFRSITRCCVTLDQLTEFAARAENLHELGVNVGSSPVWTVSVDDLRVFADVIDNPLIFCHFLEQRAAAFSSPALQTNDELDHLALYLSHNHYSTYAEDFQFETPIHWHGYRESLDKFFSGKISGEPNELPRQSIPARLEEIIDVLALSKLPGRCKAAAWILDMGGDFRNQASALIDQVLEEQQKVGRPKPATCTGDVPVTFYCSIEGGVRPDDHLVKVHTLATIQLANESERLALKLDYSSDKRLQIVTPIFFSDKDIERVDSDELRNYSQRLVGNRFQAYFATVGRHKVGRNERCPCGSGKKYKKCCGVTL